MVRDDRGCSFCVLKLFVVVGAQVCGVVEVHSLNVGVHTTDQEIGATKDMIYAENSVFAAAIFNRSFRKVMTDTYDGAQERNRATYDREQNKTSWQSQNGTRYELPQSPVLNIRAPKCWVSAVSLFYYVSEPLGPRPSVSESEGTQEALTDEVDRNDPGPFWQLESVLGYYLLGIH